eukprot:CAMPEP_0167802724 /NCGR_PEP_ID=MMETSP0111_2-20121227/19315_1 /TAXON_ID=91324 /ORGANISM="Lotharella globosa, Strain CCCM811" /LENGTH=54 /DNA_ID=CAMNT_0007698865 /DNA_START=92 /DNA_END=252 /DNA_ORIENTATION=+
MVVYHHLLDFALVQFRIDDSDEDEDHVSFQVFGGGVDWRFSSQDYEKMESSLLG